MTKSLYLTLFTFSACGQSFTLNQFWCNLQLNFEDAFSTTLSVNNAICRGYQIVITINQETRPSTCEILTMFPLLYSINVSCFCHMICAIFHISFGRNVERSVTNNLFNQIVGKCCFSSYEDIMSFSACDSAFLMIIPKLTNCLVSCRQL